MYVWGIEVNIIKLSGDGLNVYIFKFYGKTKIT